MQPKRSLTFVRINGTLVTNPELMTSHLIKHFQSTMVGGSKSASNCTDYITKAYPHLPTLGSTQLLLKPLSRDLVLTALERLRKGASPGHDGFPAEVLQRFPDYFVTLMLAAAETFTR